MLATRLHLGYYRLHCLRPEERFQLTEHTIFETRAAGVDERATGRRLQIGNGIALQIDNLLEGPG